MFWNELEVMVAQHCEYTKCHSTMCFKTVGCVLCEFQLFPETEKEKGRQRGGGGGREVGDHLPEDLLHVIRGAPRTQAGHAHVSQLVCGARLSSRSDRCVSQEAVSSSSIFIHHENPTYPTQSLLPYEEHRETAQGTGSPVVRGNLERQEVRGGPAWASSQHGGSGTASRDRK